MQSTFFFYHNLKNLNTVREISPKFQVRDGTILVDSYDPITGHVILGTREEIAGKVVTFEEGTVDILNKLNNMQIKIHLPNKSNYEVNMVLAKIGAHESKKAYIIV